MLGRMWKCCCMAAPLWLMLVWTADGNVGLTPDKRAAAPSCYGGFDLYFVLDK